MSYRKVEDDIRPILKEDMTARCDDMALYSSYVYSKIKDYGYGIGWLQKVFGDRRFRIIHGIAPFETVSRCRRKLQANDPKLRPAKEYMEERKRVEKEYKAYARKGART